MTLQKTVLLSCFTATMEALYLLPIPRERPLDRDKILINQLCLPKLVRDRLPIKSENSLTCYQHKKKQRKHFSQQAQHPSFSSELRMLLLLVMYKLTATKNNFTDEDSVIKS